MADDVPLKEHLEKVIAADRAFNAAERASERALTEQAIQGVQRETKLAFDASQAAIDKAQKAQDAHDKDKNGLLDKMTENSKEFVLRTEFVLVNQARDGKIDAMNEKIQNVTAGAIEFKGERTGSKGTWLAIGSVVGVLLGVLGAWLAIKK